MDSKYYTLITGASEGLGRSIAVECAGRNMNLILIALPGPELRNLADYIRRNYSVDVVCFEEDLCKEGSCLTIFNKVSALSLQVNILINNAGIGGTFLFEDGSLQFYEKLIRLNVLATTLITRLFLEDLKRCPKSYILNVGSMAGFFYIPKKHVYGASKSFIYSFSKSLRSELKKDKVYVSVLCPGGLNTNVPVTLLNRTHTGMAKWAVMNPEDVAPIAMAGLLKRKEVIIPGKTNRMFLVMDKILPGFVKAMMLGKRMKKLDSNNAMTQYLTVKPAMVVPVVTESTA